MCAPTAVGQPSINLQDYEQEMLELLNRARSNPVAEASRLGISLNDGRPAADEVLSAEPRQPLAPSDILHAVADSHSLDMLNRGFFGHINPDGESSVDRSAAAGYPSRFVGENLAAQGLVTPENASATLHDNLFRSWAHRRNLLNEHYQEVGVGMRYGGVQFTNGQVQDGTVVTHNFGNDLTSRRFVTGVAFEDTIQADNLFDAGEGKSGVIVEARNAQGDRIVTTTGSSGGYALHLEPDSYRILAFSQDRSTMLDLGWVDLVSANVKQDVRVEDLAAGVPVSDTISASGDGQVLDMSDPNLNLIDVCKIDLTGAGENLLTVDSASMRESLLQHVMMIRADTDDMIRFDDGWTFESERIEDGALVRRFRHGDTRVDLMGLHDYINPLDVYDVNASGSVTSSDALAIVNEMQRRQYSDSATYLLKAITSVELSGMGFFDVSGDDRVTAIDALLVVNNMGRSAQSDQASGEQITPETVAWATQVDSESTDERDEAFATDPVGIAAPGKSKI